MKKFKKTNSKSEDIECMELMEYYRAVYYANKALVSYGLGEDFEQSEDFIGSSMDILNTYLTIKDDLEALLKIKEEIYHLSRLLPANEGFKLINLHRESIDKVIDIYRKTKGETLK